MSEESHTSVESTRTANSLAKAEAWLSSVVPDPFDTVSDQEALVYLRSRGHDCHDQVTALIETWKTAEQARIDEYNCHMAARDRQSGKTSNKEREPEANVVNLAKISPMFLRDFWDAALVGDYSLDASMLRTVDWCGIAGFEQWWRRLAWSRKEMQLQGGIEEPTPAAYWLFNMVRSDYAINLMPRVLEGYLDYIGLAGPNKRQPWISDGSRGSSRLGQHLAYASAFVFAHHRLLSDPVRPEVVHQAVETICKHQDRNGGWRSETGDADVSVESTAMALHALAMARPSGWPRIAELARKWLWSVQKEDGSWTESDTPGPAYLTVLVLDAIALANGDENVTFGRRPIGYEESRPHDKLEAERPAVQRRAYLPTESDRSPILGATIRLAEDGMAETLNEPDAPNSAPTELKLDTAQERRAAVNAYIEEVWLTGIRITRKKIWQEARYQTRTEFERWERKDRRVNKTAHQRFTRILMEKPHLKKSTV